MVNGLFETSTQSAFWVHVRLLEDVVLVPACWEALILAAMIKPSVFALRPPAFSHLWVLSWSTRQPLSPAVGICRGAILIPTWT